jgi:anti-sigma regulatory factor (Ser/Thr protein kinase)
VWEAIQNAFKHGSAPGDVIRIDQRLTASGIEIVITQPRRWSDWDLELGSRRESKALDADRGYGTLIMLNLATRVTVSDHGRRVHLVFDRQ